MYGRRVLNVDTYLDVIPPSIFWDVDTTAENGFELLLTEHTGEFCKPEGGWHDVKTLRHKVL